MTNVLGRLVHAMAVLAVALSGSLAHGQVRVATYNVVGLRGSQSALRTVLGAMHTDDRPGFAVPVGLFVFVEVRNSDIVALDGIVADSAPPGVTYSRATFTSTSTEDSASGAKALYYRSDWFSEVPGTHANIATGASRNTDRWTLRLNGYTGAGSTFVVYGAHLKASTGSSNVAERESGVLAIRANADAFGPGAQVMYMGDMNFYTSTEPGYQAFVAPGNAMAVDPYGDGNWNTAASAVVHTQSPRTIVADGLVGGGMDDRFDFILPSAALADGAGFSLIPGTCRAFGNDGNHYNLAINAGSNSYYPGQSSRSNALANALHDAADHIPVLLEMRMPAWCVATLGSYPTRVVQGASGVTVPVRVSNDAPGDFTVGIDPLGYSAAGSGVLSGSGSGTAPLSPAVATVNLPVNTATVGLRTGTATVTSANQGVQNPSTALGVSVRVVRPSNPSFSIGADVNETTVDFLDAVAGGEAVEESVMVANSGFGTDQSLLNVDSITVTPGPFSLVGIEGGSNVGGGAASVSFALDPSGLAPGEYLAIATIVTRDESVPGAGTASIQATLRAVVAPGSGAGPADLNGDGIVDGADLGLLLSSWGVPGIGDLNANGITDGVDLGLLLANWS